MRRWIFRANLVCQWPWTLTLWTTAWKFSRRSTKAGLVIRRDYYRTPIRDYWKKMGTFTWRLWYVSCEFLPFIHFNSFGRLIDCLIGLDWIDWWFDWLIDWWIILISWLIGRNFNTVKISIFLRLALQKQTLLELIRERKIAEALQYAQNTLAEKGAEDPSLLEDFERALALLAFDKPEESPFGDLLELSKREEVRYIKQKGALGKFKGRQIVLYQPW